MHLSSPPHGQPRRRMLSRHPLVAGALAVALAAQTMPAQAAALWWSGTSGLLWTATNAWSTGSSSVTPPSAVPTAADTVTFNLNNVNTAQAVYLNGNQSVLGITFASTSIATGTNVTILSGTATTSTAQTLTIGSSGITTVNSAGIATIGNAANPVNVALGSSQTWTNNKDRNTVTFTVNGGISSAATSGTQTLTTAGVGVTSLLGNISNGGAGGAVALTHSGLGTINLSGTNTYSGTTSLTGGGAIVAARANSLPGYNASGRVVLSNTTGSTIAVNVDSGGWSSAEIDSVLANATFNSGNYLGVQVTTGTQTFSNSVATSIGFSKLGSGTLTLSGPATTLGSLRVGYNDRHTAGGTNVLNVAASSSVSIGTGSSDQLDVGVWTINMPSAVTSLLDLRNASSLTINVGTMRVGVATSGASTPAKNSLLQLPGSSSITAATSFVIGDSTAVAGLNSESVTTTGVGTTTIRTPTMTIVGSKASGSFTLASGGTLSLAGISGGRTALGVGDFANTGGGADTGSDNSATADFSAGTFTGTLTSLVVGRMKNNLAGNLTATLTLGTSAANRLDISGTTPTSGAVVMIGRSQDVGTGVVSGTVTIGNLDSTSQIVATDNGTAILLGSRTSTGQAAGTLNLNGGTLTITTTGTGITGGSGTSIVNFNGTTLKAGAASTNWITGLTTANVLAGGALFDTNSYAVTVAQAFSGTGGLTKLGPGVLTLSGSSSYGGPTSVTAGQLQIASGGAINSTSGITLNGSSAELRYNSATPLSAPITFTQGTISGTGTIGTAVTAGTGDILSPGNSPGIQAYTSGLTLGPGGQYTWEINNWGGSAGTNYDQLAVSNSPLVVSATAGGTFKVLVTSLTGSNTAGAVPGFVGSTGTNFTIATSSAGITGFGKDAFTIDSSTAFANVNTLPTNAGFWLTTNGGSTSLILNYAPSATYNLSAAASAAAIHVGGTATITATVTSSTAAVTNPDSVAYAGLSLSGGVGPLTSTSGTLAGGASGSGNVAFTGTAGGAFTFNPSVTSATNVNIGTTANAGSSSGVTVSVYNYAAANAISGTVNFGTVLKGTGLSQTLVISNTAPIGSYSEKLDAAFGTLTGGATTNGGSISVLAAGGTSSALSIYLASGSAGNATGSAQVNFTSNGLGTSGLGTTSLDSQMVSLKATVLDPAVASFLSGSTATTSLLLDFGSVQQNASVSPLGFDLYNLVQTSGYTADLALLGILSGTGNTGAITTTLTGTFDNLGAGLFNAYTASLATDTLGAFTNTYTLSFKSANNGQVFAGDSTQSLSLTVTGVIVVPEPGATALAGIGVMLVGWSLSRRRRSSVAGTPYGSRVERGAGSAT